MHRIPEYPGRQGVDDIVPVPTKVGVLLLSWEVLLWFYYKRVFPGFTWIFPVYELLLFG